MKKVSYPDGKTLSYSYDRNGNIKTQINQDGYGLTYVYDSMGRVIKITDTIDRETFYEYDIMGKVAAVIDALGNITRYQYTPSGKLAQVIDALGNKTAYSYDSGDNLIYMCHEGDGEIRATRFERNSLGQVEDIFDVLGRAEHYVYDSLGRPIKKIDRENFETAYEYTFDGKPKRVRYGNDREVFFNYNPLRQLIEIQDWLGTTRMERNVQGRIEKVIDPVGRETFYEWGKLGERRGITYPDGQKISYEYDRHLRLQNLIIPSGQEITYRYDQVGRLLEKNFGEELRTSWKYDTTGQLTELIHEDWKGVLDRYQYGYDAMGNKVSIKKERRGLPEESGCYQYSYDAVYRLAAVIRDETLMTRYIYDAFGNRQRKEDVAAGSSTAYTYSALNQLIAIQEEGLGNSLRKDYAYDNRGNLISEQEEGDLLHSYEYGVLNRLEKSRSRNGKIDMYTYNGLGQLIKHNSTEYLLDITKPYNNLIQTREGESIKSFYWDSNLAAMEDTQGDDRGEEGIHPYLLDELGSPLRVEKKVSIYESYGYDAFGEDLYGNQGVYQPFGYTGECLDPSSGTYYLRARYYQPTTGRFLTEDPARAGLNWYTYCNNNPIMFKDPLGLTPYAVESKYDDLYRLYSSDRIVDGVKQGMGIIPFAGIAFGIGDYVNGHHELSVNNGKNDLDILYNDITNNSVFSTTMDITTGAFEIIENVGTMNEVNYLENAKLLGGLGKGLGVIGTGIQAYDTFIFFAGKDHITEQVVDETFYLYMYSSSVSNLQQKYAFAYLYVEQAIADGRITYESSLGGRLQSASFVSSDEYYYFIGVLKEFDATIGESSQFIEDLYDLYDYIMSNKEKASIDCRVRLS